MREGERQRERKLETGDGMTMETRNEDLIWEVEVGGGEGIGGITVTFLKAGPHPVQHAPHPDSDPAPN